MSSGKMTRWRMAFAMATLAGFMATLRRRPLVTAPTSPAVDIARCEPGSGGYYGTWPRGSSSSAVAHHIEFQYAGIEHQTETAMSGMWLFLATEVLFFGGLFLLYMLYRAQYPHAVAVASQRTEIGIGTINTVLLLTSSAVFAWGLGHVRRGDNRRLMWACALVAALGVGFLALKGYEWSDDFAKHLFPGADFAIAGPDRGGAQLFWGFYFVATAVHGLHMIVGVSLVSWLGWTAWRGRYSAAYFTPVEIVGLYWSFVDMVWLVLYPLIYLVGRSGT